MNRNRYTTDAAPRAFYLLTFIALAVAPLAMFAVR